MKRKTGERPSIDGDGLPESKKRALSHEEATARFRDGLFNPAEQQKYTEAYAKSTPYVHKSSSINGSFSDIVCLLATTMVLFTL